MSTRSAAAHRSSHRELLPAYVARRDGGRIDAIVAPAARPAANLLPAMELAARVGCEFVALCSGQAGLAETAGLAAEVPGLRWTLGDFHPAGAGHEELFRFGTGDVPEATAGRHSDLSRKRNAGLLLARSRQWRGVLFLDDDIRDLTPALFRRAEAGLGPGRMAGLVSTEFPDNSVVCHALRLSGRPQEVFVSGSALAVDTTRIKTFFPDIYNEDWFFLYDRVHRRKVTRAGEVRQAPYDPYAHPGRAAGEEFGDLLAEGLMSLLHAEVPVQYALTEEYWQQAIAQRRELLDGIARRLAHRVLRRAPAARRSVAAARATLDRLDGAVLRMWVERWREDTRDWGKRLATLPPAPSTGEALEGIGIAAVTELRSAQVDRQSLLPAAAA